VWLRTTTRLTSRSERPRARRFGFFFIVSPDVVLQPTCGAVLWRLGGVASAPHAAALWRWAAPRCRRSVAR
jgi:hypothetical protein